MQKRPPVWMTIVLERVSPNHLQDEMIGDFIENYAHLCDQKGEGFAKRKSIIFILFSLPTLLYQRNYNNSNTIAMLRNYMIIAIRNLKKNISYSFINIVGLAIGLTCCMLIGLYVNSELGYDEFHKNAEEIYRVNLTFNTPQGSDKTYMTPTALLPTLLRGFNEVESGTRLYYVGGFSAVTVQKDKKVNQESNFFYTDSTFFDVFDFEILSGNSQSCLQQPNSMVITESIAKKYFGKTDVLNEILKVNGTDYTITAVTQDVPGNSHFTYDFLCSFSTLRQAKYEIWGSANYATYVRLNPVTSLTNITNGLNEKVAAAIGDGFGPITLNFEFMSLLDLHLKSDIADEMQPQNSIGYIRIISVVGMMVLIIACINYMNLATARSLERAKEVGLRKVVGAYRKHVFMQFMGESFITTGIAFILAILLVSFSLSEFNALSGKSFLLSDLLVQNILVALIIVYLAVALMAGVYPAVALSGYKPGTVLKGSFKTSKGGNLTRKVLVIFQFCIGISLLIGTFIVSEQLSFMQNKRLGYNKENVLVLPTNRYVEDNFFKISTELERRSDVEGVSIATESPVNIGGGYSMVIPGVMDESLAINAIATDIDFLRTMQMNLIEGRHFNKSDEAQVAAEDYDEREYAFIVNEEVLANANLTPDQAVGKRLEMNGRNGEIIGVVEDFHATSLHRKISPLVIFAEADYYNTLFIRVKGDRLQQTIRELQVQWQELVPNQPFTFTFMDDEYAAMYDNEVRLGKVFKVFTVLAIIISSLGLFGLVSFSVLQRSKEIGVRKILGASIVGIIGLLGRDFAKLIIVAFFIAIPLAWYAMQLWLEDFTYKIAVGPEPFILAGGILFILSALTVSFQTLKAALTDPVKVIRND